MNTTVIEKITNPSETDIQTIQTLIRVNPTWHRTRLSKELCKIWDWKDSAGNLKDMACRNFLLKLHRSNKIQLPPLKRTAPKRNVLTRWIDHDDSILAIGLNDLQPLKIEEINPRSNHYQLVKLFLREYHYLSYHPPIGKNMMYMVFDRFDRPLSCLVFEAASWRVKDRDDFIGWSNSARQMNLEFVANNSRFLILPWVRVPNLASNVLGTVIKRLNKDWQRKYNQSLYLLETFIEHNRFKGICYQASNWHFVGRTKGRTRNDKHHEIKVPIKDIYLLPLRRKFRELLS